MVLFVADKRHARDHAVINQQVVKFKRAAPHRFQVEIRVQHLVERQAFEQVLGQNAEGHVIEERRVRFGDLELHGFVAQADDLHLRPQVFHILRIERSRAFHQLNREDDIIAGDGLSILPGRVGTQAEIVDGAVGGCPPRFSQVRFGHAARIEAHHAAVDQAIHVAVWGVVPVEQGIQASHRADQSLGVDAAAGGMRQDGSNHRALAEE